MRGIPFPAALLSVVFGIVVACSHAVAQEPPITALAFAPGGRTVVVGSQAGLSLRRWPDLEEVRRLEAELQHVNHLAFSPDGRFLAAAGGTPAQDGTVELFSWPQGALSLRQKCHADLVYCVAWYPDSRRLATASLDHSCKILDVRSGAAVTTLDGHSQGLTSVGVLNEGSTLVTAGIDQVVRVWELSESSTGSLTVRLQHSLHQHTGAVHGLAIRPASSDGLPMLASVGEDRTVRFWQPTIGRMVRFVRLDSVPLAAAWSSDGATLVVACQDGHARAIDPETLECLHDMAVLSHWAYAVAIHPLEEDVLVGGAGGQLTVFHLGPN